MSPQFSGTSLTVLVNDYYFHPYTSVGLMSTADPGNYVVAIGAENASGQVPFKLYNISDPTTGGLFCFNHNDTGYPLPCIGTYNVTVALNPTNVIVPAFPIPSHLYTLTLECNPHGFGTNVCNGYQSGTSGSGTVACADINNQPLSNQSCAQADNGGTVVIQYPANSTLTYLCARVAQPTSGSSPYAPNPTWSSGIFNASNVVCPGNMSIPLPNQDVIISANYQPCFFIAGQSPVGTMNSSTPTNCYVTVPGGETLKGWYSGTTVQLNSRTQFNNYNYGNYTVSGTFYQFHNWFSEPPTNTSCSWTNSAGSGISNGWTSNPAYLKCSTTLGELPGSIPVGIAVKPCFFILGKNPANGTMGSSTSTECDISVTDNANQSIILKENGWYSGTTVQLNAHPFSGYSFSNWVTGGVHNVSCSWTNSAGSGISNGWTQNPAYLNCATKVIHLLANGPQFSAVLTSLGWLNATFDTYTTPYFALQCVSSVSSGIGSGNPCTGTQSNPGSGAYVCATINSQSQFCANETNGGLVFVPYNKGDTLTYLCANYGGGFDSVSWSQFYSSSQQCNTGISVSLPDSGLSVEEATFTPAPISCSISLSSASTYQGFTDSATATTISSDELSPAGCIWSLGDLTPTDSATCSGAQSTVSFSTPTSGTQTISGTFTDTAGSVADCSTSLTVIPYPPYYDTNVYPPSPGSTSSSTSFSTPNGNLNIANTCIYGGGGYYPGDNLWDCVTNDNNGNYYWATSDSNSNCATWHVYVPPYGWTTVPASDIGGLTNSSNPGESQEEVNPNYC